MREVNVNYDYLAHYVRSHVRPGRLYRVLDYGCGDAGLVSTLREQAVSCWGAESFYAGGTRSNPELQGLLATDVVRQIRDDGHVPFSDGFFHLIYSNQVLEHVADLDYVVDELSRLLAPGGLMYHHFPSREVLREGHIGIPMAHRMRHRAARRAYTRTLHRAGLGYHSNEEDTHAEWADRSLQWLDDYCFYRPYREIRAAFEPRYRIRHREIDYIRFRARDWPPLARIANADVLVPAYQRAFRRLGFMAIELTAR